jgi:subtilisin
MSAKSDETRDQTSRSASKGGNARKRLGSRPNRYMIAPTAAGINEAAMIERLQSLGGIDVVRTLAATHAACPPVVVARMTEEKAVQLRQSAAGKLIVEPDQPLIAASAAASSVRRPSVVTTASGRGFATTIQVFGANDEPVEQAEVQLIGQQWTAQGLTGSDGKVVLNLYGEMPDGVRDILVRPRSEYWGLWKRHPNIQTDSVNIVALQALPEVKRFGWGAQAMHLDRLPAECRGGGVKIGLIDSGVATSHAQLSAIAHGFEADGDDAESWSEDPTGHGTACAGVIFATDAGESVGGYAPDAEMHVCKLPGEAYCIDLVAALDHCIQAGVDLACIGFGCRRGSTIVEQRIVAAKRAGIAVVAAAGSNGESVLFPACSRHVLAVAAVGQAGTFPDETPHAARAAATGRAVAEARAGLFVPAFSCRGQEVDLAAPGVAVMSCQSPDGYVAGDGTSLAAAHVAALAALVLAHGADFQREFALRDARRVERLFQILKATAQAIGDPTESGAGVPDALRALGLRPPAEAYAPPLAAGLRDMHHALCFAGLKGANGGSATVTEPARGPVDISQVPLNVAPPSILPAGGAKSGVGALKAAMQMAGLAG